jgi:hypothetical protein
MVLLQVHPVNTRSKRDGNSQEKGQQADKNERHTLVLFLAA